MIQNDTEFYDDLIGKFLDSSPIEEIEQINSSFYKKVKEPLLSKGSLIAIRLPQDVLAAVKNKAKNENRNVSEIVRIYIKRGLEQDNLQEQNTESWINDY